MFFAGFAVKRLACVAWKRGATLVSPRALPVRVLIFETRTPPALRLPRKFTPPHTL
jgi:hypothetical protein